jgi:hypothetical protein
LDPDDPLSNRAHQVIFPGKHWITPGASCYLPFMARPLTYGAEITLSITPGRARALRALARKAGISPSALLAELVDHEARRRRGEIRCVVIAGEL